MRQGEAAVRAAKGPGWPALTRSVDSARSRSATYAARRGFDGARFAVTVGMGQATLRRGNLRGTRSWSGRRHIDLHDEPPARLRAPEIDRSATF